MGRDVIIACDFNSKEEVINFLGKFKEEKPFVKIGMELFYAERDRRSSARSNRWDTRFSLI